VNRIPLKSTDESLFNKSADGIMFCKLINKSIPDTVDERVINIKKKLTGAEKQENLSLVIQSAKAIGVNVIGVNVQQLSEGKVSTVLNLYWQIIRIGLLERLNVKYHPELIRLLGKGEQLQNLMNLAPDMILLRWFNHQLLLANQKKVVVDNFGAHVKDGIAFTHLLNHLFPEECTLEPLKENDLEKRATMIVNLAEKVGVNFFLIPRVIFTPVIRLNLGFVGYLFDQKPNLKPLTPEEMVKINPELFSGEGSRETRVFCLWMNCLGIDPLVNNLGDDLKDGLVLLNVMDKVSPGIVVWNGVNKTNLNKFKMVENCNRVIETAKKMGLSVVGVGGSDINNGVSNLILGLLWQLMRFQLMTILKSLSPTKGKEITEAEIVQWAVNSVRASGKATKIDSFKDATIKNGRFLIDLLNSINNRIINYDLVTDGDDPQDALQNAKYAISIARKLGATIFLLPEDIVEVKPKMLLTFFASVMAVALAPPPPAPPKEEKKEAPAVPKEEKKESPAVPKEEKKEPPKEAPKKASAKPAVEEEEEYEYEEGEEEEEAAPPPSKKKEATPAADDEYEYEEVEEEEE